MRLTVRRLLALLIPLTLALTGCTSLTGGGADDGEVLSAGDSTGSETTGVTTLVSGTYEAGWTVQVADPVTGGVYFVGTGWPTVTVPSNFVNGTATFTWENAAATGGFFVRLVSDAGDVLWEASGDASPVTAEFAATDAETLSQASFMTAGPLAGNVALDATFQLELAFEVPAEPAANGTA